MKTKIFIAGLCIGAIAMDLINCHLYRLGSVVHWLDVLSILLWPLMVWAVAGMVKIGVVESDLNEWIAHREKRWEEKTYDR